MKHVLTEAEVALRANELKREESAWKALNRQPRRLLILLVPIAFASASAVALRGELPALEAVLFASVIPLVLLLFYEVTLQRRQINALIELLRTHNASDA